MAISLKPSEVSDILLGQLQDMKNDLQFEEIGKALQVSDGVVRIYGLDHAEAGELLDCGNGVMAVVMNLEADNVGAVLMGPTDLVKEGMVVRRTGRIASIGVCDALLGRVVDPDLIGGFVFDIDDAIIDKSVARKLELIKLQFIEKNRRIV